jgi:hypothetical protein
MSCSRSRFDTSPYRLKSAGRHEPVRSREMKRATDYKLRNSLGWHCACCPQLITSVSEGWVEWLASEDEHGATILSGLRLVHRASCRYDPRKVFGSARSVVEGLSLERFVGFDGLNLLLSLLAAGELPTGDVIEMAKRVQIPGYELARNLIGQQNLPQVLSPSLGHGCYLQSEISDLIRRAVTDPNCRESWDSNPPAA